MAIQFIKDVSINGTATISQIANATVDTDTFLVSDGGVVKYRTGTQLLSDLGIVPGVADLLQHQVKAGAAITIGQAVYVTGAVGTNMIVGLASNGSEATSSKTMGLLDATVVLNDFANVITQGLLAGLNTGTAVEGDPVWLGTSGNLLYGLANKPSAPIHLVYIGIVTRASTTVGEIFVRVQNGFELEELHNVSALTPGDGQVLTYETSTSLWKPKTPLSGTGALNYLAKFNPAGSTITSSIIFDNGTNVGIGIASNFLGIQHISSNSSPALTTPVSSSAALSPLPQLFLSTPDSGYSAGLGGSLGLGGRAGSGGVIGIFAAVSGRKEVAGVDDYKGYLSFATSGNGTIQERMRLSSLGYLGIGATNPTQPLHVVGNARVTGAILDSNNLPGTSGQVLSSTVTGTSWVASGGAGSGPSLGLTVAVAMGLANSIY